jgi:hypothetical protein
LYLNVSERNYGTAIVNLKQIIDTIFTDNVIDKIVSHEYEKELAKIKTDPETLKKKKKSLEDNMKSQRAELKDLNKKILKYGTFMATIVHAKSSDDVQTIIESIAMPAGSFRVKRESDYNISLNGFAGFFGGHEYIKNTENNIINNFAISAPIGIAFTKGKCSRFVINKKNKDKGLAHGLFVSLIDIGALASFRFGDDSSQVASTVELKQILAPGIFYTLYFRNSPLTLTVGGQMGPLLREITPSDAKLEENFYYRVGVSLVVDIPLFNLYNKN